MVLPFLFPAALFLRLRVRKGEEPSGGKVLRLIQIRLATLRLTKIPKLCQEKNVVRRPTSDVGHCPTSRRVRISGVSSLHKRRQPLIGPHNGNASHRRDTHQQSREW